MSVWTSNYAIMRDLSKAQGRLVPVDINSAIGVAVAANEKPPQVATEETEEEYYKKFAGGDFDHSTTPDFGLIQHMLEMVKGGNDSSSDSSINSDIIQISKVYVPSTTLKATEADKKSKRGVKLMKADKKTLTNPTEVQVKTEASTNFGGGDAPYKKKRQRNVAVSSLLAALETKENNNNNNEPIKLLKPTDFITSKAVTESVKKVDEWFSNRDITESSVPKTFPSLQSVSMFKKRSPSEKSVKQIKKETDTPTSPLKSTGMFKPSSKADEYYQKYLEKSQLNTSIKEDIWQKAERLMKEADAKRAAKDAERVQELSDIILEYDSQSLDEADGTPTEDDSSTKLDVKWALTEPRHAGEEDDNCIVCTATRKYRNKINKTIASDNEVLTSNTSYSTADELPQD